MRFIKTTASLIVAVFLAGCAGTESSVTLSQSFDKAKRPLSVSPVMYETLDCKEIKQEASVLSARAQKVSGFQNAKAGNAKTIIWPAGLTVNPKKQNNADLVRIQFQFEALEKAAVRENCNLQFDRGNTPEQKSAQSGWQTSVSS